MHHELASALYAAGLLSFGKAAELAGVSRFAFCEVLAHRGIARHYGDDDVNEDISYAAGA